MRRTLSILLGTMILTAAVGCTPNTEGGISLDPSKDKKISKLQKDIIKLKSDNKALQGKLIIADQQMQDATERQNKLLNKYNELRFEKDQLNKQIDTLRHFMTESKKNKKLLNEAIDKIVKMQDEIKQLRSQQASAGKTVAPKKQN